MRRRTTMALAAALVIMCFGCPMAVMGIGAWFAVSGIDSLNVQLADYPELADAIIGLSGGLAIMMFGVIGLFVLGSLLLLPKEADGVHDAVQDVEDIEQQKDAGDGRERVDRIDPRRER